MRILIQTRFWCGKGKNRDILKDLDIDGTSMDLREKGWEARSGLFWLRKGTVGCCSEHGNVISNSTNYEECSEELLTS